MFDITIYKPFTLKSDNERKKERGKPQKVLHICSGMVLFAANSIKKRIIILLYFTINPNVALFNPLSVLMESVYGRTVWVQPS